MTFFRDIEKTKEAARLVEADGGPRSVVSHPEHEDRGTVSSRPAAALAQPPTPSPGAPGPQVYRVITENPVGSPKVAVTILRGELKRDGS